MKYNIDLEIIIIFFLNLIFFVTTSTDDCIANRLISFPPWAEWAHNNSNEMHRCQLHASIAILT